MSSTRLEQQHDDLRVAPRARTRRSHIAPVTTREELIYLLSRASELEHHALCRCGGSKNKPFCDGMHWLQQFP